MAIDKLDTIGNVTRSIKTKEEQVSLAKEIGKILDQFVNSIKAQLNEDDRAEIILYIVDYYKDLSLKDLKKAFQLAVIQGYGDNIEYSYYNKFSATYVCRFLNLYREYKRKENLKKPLAIEKPKKALPISEEASKKTRRKIAELTYKDVCDKGTFILYNVDGVFDELQVAGLVDDWEQLKNMYISQVQKPKQDKEKKKSDKEDRSVGLIGRLILDLPIFDVPEDDLKQAKKLYLRDRFMYWKEQKREKVFIEN